MTAEYGGMYSMFFLPPPSLRSLWIHYLVCPEGNAMAWVYNSTSMTSYYSLFLVLLQRNRVFLINALRHKVNNNQLLMDLRTNKLHG